MESPRIGKILEFSIESRTAWIIKMIQIKITFIRVLFLNCEIIYWLVNKVTGFFSVQFIVYCKHSCSLGSICNDSAIHRSEK